MANSSGWIPCLNNPGVCSNRRATATALSFLGVREPGNGASVRAGAQDEDGREKAQPTIDRTRRVLRLALQHAEREGVIEAAPIEAKRAKKDAEPAPETSKPKRTKRVPLHQREAIGLDDQRDEPAAAEDDPAQITYASTGEPVTE
jgi:hypothetical protein